MNIQKFLLSALLAFAALAAHALEVVPYTADALPQAQKADKPVALHFHADWCPTCRAQTDALRQLKSENGLDITVLVANYDTEKELKRRFNVRTQATLVVMHGDKETDRLVGDTSRLNILMALKSAL
jgi:thiol-disulfide isomerase/thioredoxin